MSDGELEEGQVWEAAMVAAHYKLDNLLLIIDYNGFQVDGKIDQITGMAPIADKWKAFRWNVFEINGNDLSEVMHMLDNIPVNGQPTVIISHTVMGNGISFLHGRDDIHYVKWSKEDTTRALKELAR
jgi:transketolase